MTTPTPARVDDVADRLSDLTRKPFLDLKPPREDLHQPRQLRQPNDTARRDVSDMGLAEEWQEVMLAERVELDVTHHDHVVVRLLEQALADSGPRVLR